MAAQCGLTINNRIKKLSVLTDYSQTHFERISKEPIENNVGINLYKTTISKNDSKYVLYSIIDENDDAEIILPINENLELFHFPKRVARLFLYYPLIGSEDFGINFIINCNKFLPTEPRDGIHLKSNKDQVKEQEAENRRIIEKASESIFTFIKSNIVTVSNPLLYAKINFKRNSDNQLLNDYFSELQDKWVEEFQTLPLVESSTGFISVTDSCFFNLEILENTDCFDEIYELLSLFKDNLPVKSIVNQWSQFVNEWSNDKLNFIGHKEIVSFVSSKHLNDFNTPNLIKYYNSLIHEEKLKYFSDFNLIPNLDGKFCSLSSLLAPKNINRILIEIGKSIIPKSIEKLVHEDFLFNFSFEKFDRKDFSNSVKNNLDEKEVSSCICLFENSDIGKYNEKDLSAARKIDSDFFLNLIRYCKLNNNTNSQSKPTLLLKKLCKYYDLDDNLILLNNLDEQENNIDIRSARKILVQIFFNLLQYHNQDWVKDNVCFLLNIAKCNEDSVKEVFASSKIYPNQINELKSINDLKRDNNILEEIKELYNKVTKNEIRKELIYIDFNSFVAEDRFVKNKYLTTQIEDTFFNTDINNINEHPFKDDILNIISKLRERNYADLFPRLDDKKANLMLEIVTNEKTKDDIFSIVTLKESQLNKLGKLVQKDNFETILNIANSLIQQEIENKADFKHKYDIGTNIEKLIREKLSIELQDRVSFYNGESLETSDIQGGQDIIVSLDGTPVYYIEVKSRWNSNSSVSMSKLQLQRAVEEEERYALCSVDISRYTGSNDKYNLPTSEVLPLTRFVSRIGGAIKPLIEDNLIAEKNQEESIHLIDYRGIIPQEIIQKGSSFQDFVELLIQILNSKIKYN